MSLGDITDLIKNAGILNNTDWLEVNPSTYKNLPFDDLPNYVAIPKLQEYWNHLKDNNINLVPNLDTNYNVRPKIDQEQGKENISKLVNFVKQLMMSGKTGSHIIEIMKSKIDPKIIKSAKEYLTKLAHEQGLLGNVYIDPTAFNNCKEGSEVLGNKAKLAKFVLAMDKCKDCSINKKGRCEAYKKIVVSEIPYTERVLKFYENHLQKVKNITASIDSKEELRKAFIKEIKDEPKIAEFKPVDTGSEEKTLEQKKKEYDTQVEDLKKSLSNMETEKISKELGFQLVKGLSGKAIKSFINEHFNEKEIRQNKDIFNGILSKQGSLGKVYVNAGSLPFQACSEAREHFNTNQNQVQYLITDKPNFCTCGSSSMCNSLNMFKVSSVDMISKLSWKQEFEKYAIDIQEKIASIFNEDPIRGLRLAFIQNEIKQPDFEAMDDLQVTKKASVDYVGYENKIIPSKESVHFSPDNIAKALKNGYSVSSILSFAKRKGSINSEIKNNFAEAFTKLPNIKAYQLDIAEIKAPKELKIIKSYKDMALNNTSKVSNNAGAPIENYNEEFGVKQAMNVNIDNVKPKDIEIKELNQFVF